MDERQEPTIPIEEKNSFNWRVFILWPVMILCLYVFSLGPVAMMDEKGLITTRNSYYFQIYLPLFWVYEATPLHKPLGLYLHLWAPKNFDKNGNES